METQKTLESQLEILIPTYNRKAYLEHTLTQLTAPESPVKNCSITVLDNASEDGTAEVVDRFAAQFKNITPIHHKKNIGGNANITRAYELAVTAYVWVVCDDDSFKWEAWGEIQQALETNAYDLLLTRKNDLKGTSDIARIFRQCSFVPAGIYRTSLITGGVLMNMYNNIPNMFPHLALISEIFNRQGSIFLPQGEIMDQCTFDLKTSGDKWNTRGSDTYVPETMKNMFWTVGFLSSTLMIKDKKIRTYILEHVGNHGFFGYIWGSFRKNYTHYRGYTLNKALVRQVCCTPLQRIQFDLACAGLALLSLFRKQKK